MAVAAAPPPAWAERHARMWKAYLDGNRSQRTLMLAAHVRHPEARQAILTGWPEWGIAAFQDRQDEVAAWDLEHPDKPVRPPRVPKPKAPPARPSSKPPEAEVVVKAAKSSAEKASASAELAVAAQERAVEALEVIKAAASDTEAWDTFRSKVIETADRALAQWGPMREAIAEALGEAMAAFRAGTFKRYRTVRRFDPRFPGRIQTVEEEYIDRIAVIRVMTDLVRALKDVGAGEMELAKLLSFATGGPTERVDGDVNLNGPAVIEREKLLVIRESQGRELPDNMTDAQLVATLQQMITATEPPGG